MAAWSSYDLECRAEMAPVDQPSAAKASRWRSGVQAFPLEADGSSHITPEARG